MAIQAGPGTETIPHMDAVEGSLQRMYFVGVSTGESSIMRLFPRWAVALGLDAEIVGIDLPLQGPESLYREALEIVIADPLARGGLVTTHKVSLFNHASTMFDRLDEWARLCGEISCIAKRSGSLEGWAKDPITSWSSFVEIGGADYFARYPEAEALCLGAGGSGAAFTCRLLSIDYPPARIILTNRSEKRLDTVREIHRRIESDVEVVYHQVSDPTDTDRLVNHIAPRSVVVNATGLGKDRPGSPITNEAAFPQDGIVWDFNYRGSLEFLEQARVEAPSRNLTVEDGWRYFLHGWSDHIAEVFDLRISKEQFDSLALIADRVRGK
ncbi:MAG: shikimate dehydrogenase family protein [Acidimicrobiia bacterium]